MKYAKTVIKALAMFVISALVVGTIFTVNWKSNILVTEIRGEKAGFVNAEYKSGTGSRQSHGAISAVTYKTGGGTVRIEVTRDYPYDPCDSYTVAVSDNGGNTRTYTYTPDESTVRILENALEKASEKPSSDVGFAKLTNSYREPGSAEMEKVRSLTFLCGGHDLTGFTLDAAVADTSPGRAEKRVLLKLTDGNDNENYGKLDIPDWAFFTLDSITAFRNYKPWSKAMTPVLFIAPFSVFLLCGIIGAINMCRDFFKKRKIRKELRTPIFRRTD